MRCCRGLPAERAIKCSVHVVFFGALVSNAVFILVPPSKDVFCGHRKNVKDLIIL
jgi:hypothetical protein